MVGEYRFRRCYMKYYNTDYGDNALFSMFARPSLCINCPMARLASIVIPDLPHHVTQRGNGGAKVFFGIAVTVHFFAMFSLPSLRSLTAWPALPASSIPDLLHPAQGQEHRPAGGQRSLSRPDCRASHQRRETRKARQAAQGKKCIVTVIDVDAGRTQF